MFLVAQSQQSTIARSSVERVPRGVVCLLSALRFHNLTTQSPFEVWLAIGEKSRLPRFENPPLRVVRFSGTALTYGFRGTDRGCRRKYFLSGENGRRLLSLQT